MAAQTLRERAVNVLGHGVRARKHHGVCGRVRHQGLANGLAVAGQQLQRMLWNASLVQHGYGLRGDQIGLLRRFGNHHVAGCQRRSYLAGKDGQRKIPGADAHHHAQGAVAVVVQVLLGLLRVIAQKVDGLAHFRDRIGQSLAGFAAQQAHQRLQLRLHAIGSALQGLCAGIDRRCLPDGGCVLGLCHGQRHFCMACHAHLAQHIAGIGWVVNGLCGQVRSVGRLGRQRCHTAQQRG